ncbi:MAG: hypothetical protein Q8L23_11445 [Caulobacter sp.]|nr:hypothetical protein [Caulobacter sp.]
MGAGRTSKLKIQALEAWLAAKDGGADSPPVFALQRHLTDPKPKPASTEVDDKAVGLDAKTGKWSFDHAAMELLGGVYEVEARGALSDAGASNGYFVLAAKGDKSTQAPISSLWRFGKAATGGINVLGLLSLRNPQILLCSYNLTGFDGRLLEGLVGDRLTNAYFAASPSLDGLRFQGELGFNTTYFTEARSLASGASGDAAAAFDFVRTLFDRAEAATVPVQGLIWAEHDEAVSLDLTIGRPDAPLLDLGNSSVGLTIDSCGILLTLDDEVEESGAIERFTAAGRLHLAGYGLETMLLIDLGQGTASFSCEPDLGIQFDWLERLVGPGFAESGGAVLKSVGTANLRLQTVGGGIAWKPSLAISHAALVIGTTGLKLLGGDLTASLLAEVEFLPDSKASFDAELKGQWVWSGLTLDVSLSTRTGDFHAGVSVDHDLTIDLASPKLLKSSKATPPGQDDAPAHLDEGLRLNEIEFHGNYRDSSVGFELSTSGFHDIVLTENLLLRLGNFEADGDYEGGKTPSWRLHVAADAVIRRRGPAVKAEDLVSVVADLGSKRNSVSLKIAKLELDGVIKAFAGEGESFDFFNNFTFTKLEADWDSETGIRLSCGDVGGGFFDDKLRLTDFKFAYSKKDGVSGGVILKIPSAKKVNGAGDAKSETSVELKVAHTPGKGGKAGKWTFKGDAKGLNVSALLAAFEVKGAPTVMAERLTVTLESQSGAETTLTLGVTLAGDPYKASLLLKARKPGKVDGTAPPTGARVGKSDWEIVFAGCVDIDGKGLPLVGDLLGGQAFGINFGILYTNLFDGGVNQKSLETFLASPKAGETPNAAVALWTSPEGGERLRKNWSIYGKVTGLDIEKTRKAVVLEAAPAPAGDTGKAPPKIDTKTDDRVADGAGDPMSWTVVDRRLGPLTFGRLGYGVIAAGDAKAGRLAIDATLSLGPLRLAFMGLGVDVQIPSLNISPHLDGLAIDMKSGPVTIAGSLMKRGAIYTGSASARIGTLGLSAIGQFAVVNNRTSFFLFAVANVTIGGPPAFFVTGIAAGMGYDSRLVLPPPSGVADFSLIQFATGKPVDMRALERDVLISPDSLWFAAGVCFTSFEIIESVALCVVSLHPGGDIDLDLIGLSTMTLPSSRVGDKIDPIAKVGIGLRGHYSSREGTAYLYGELTADSYVFSRKARLSGGFAFQLWFSGSGHDGDFVATVGGYHPQFRVPAHYPRPSRFALAWDVTEALSIKGAGYFALTPNAIMAGGALEVVYKSPSVRASFRASADFLAYWKPFSYVADISIAVDAVVEDDTLFGHVRLSLHISAALHLAGPPFHGIVELDLVFFTLSIPIGEQVSEDDQPVDLSTLAEDMFPPGSLIARVTGGATGGANVADEWVLPCDWRGEIIVESAAPVTRLYQPRSKTWVDAIDDVSAKRNRGLDPGIAPYGINARSYACDLKVSGIATVGDASGENWDIRQHFSDLPPALWNGRGEKPDRHLRLDKVNGDTGKELPRGLTVVSLRLPRAKGVAANAPPPPDVVKMKSSLKLNDLTCLEFAEAVR